jgi:hypothetical protein
MSETPLERSDIKRGGLGQYGGHADGMDLTQPSAESDHDTEIAALNTDPKYMDAVNLMIDRVERLTSVAQFAASEMTEPRSLAADQLPSIEEVALDVHKIAAGHHGRLYTWVTRIYNPLSGHAATISVVSNSTYHDGPYRSYEVCETQPPTDEIWQDNTSEQLGRPRRITVDPTTGKLLDHQNVLTAPDLHVWLDDIGEYPTVIDDALHGELASQPVGKTYDLRRIMRRSPSPILTLDEVATQAAADDASRERFDTWVDRCGRVAIFAGKAAVVLTAVGLLGTGLGSIAGYADEVNGGRPGVEHTIKQWEDWVLGLDTEQDLGNQLRNPLTRYIVDHYPEIDQSQTDNTPTTPTEPGGRPLGETKPS